MKLSSEVVASPSTIPTDSGKVLTDFMSGRADFLLSWVRFARIRDQQDILWRLRHKDPEEERTLGSPGPAASRRVMARRDSCRRTL